MFLSRENLKAILEMYSYKYESLSIMSSNLKFFGQNKLITLFKQFNLANSMQNSLSNRSMKFSCIDIYGGTLQDQYTEVSATYAPDGLHRSHYTSALQWRCWFSAMQGCIWLSILLVIVVEYQRRYFCCLSSSG